MKRTAAQQVHRRGSQRRDEKMIDRDTIRYEKSATRLLVHILSKTLLRILATHEVKSRNLSQASKMSMEFSDRREACRKVALVGSETETSTRKASALTILSTAVSVLGLGVQWAAAACTQHLTIRSSQDKAREDQVMIPRRLLVLASIHLSDLVREDILGVPVWEAVLQIRLVDLEMGISSKRGQTCRSKEGLMRLEHR